MDPKDADILDRYLHGVKETRKAYIDRCNKVLIELGLEKKIEVLGEDQNE